MKLSFSAPRPFISLCTVALLLGSVPLLSAQSPAAQTTGEISPVLAADIPVFYPVADQTGRVGFTFTYQTAAQNSPRNYSATGLPPGLNIDSASGLISGVLTEAGVFTPTISAANDAGSGNTTLTITVAPPYPFVTITPDVANGYPSQGVNASFLITREGDASEDLIVSFRVKGSAKFGTDYEGIKLSKKLKAGKMSKRIVIRGLNPANLTGGKKGVKIVLDPGTNYQLGDNTVAKVKINYTP